MTVENQIPYQSYTANGEQVRFAFSFYIEDKDNFSVRVNDQLVSKTQYTYETSTNSILFNTAPTKGSLIEIERNTSADRAINYSTYNNTFRPEVLNHDIDRIWRRLQELAYTDSVLFFKLATEIAERIEGDQKLQLQINSLVKQVDTNTLNITKNKKEIDDLISNLSQEIANRIQADLILKEMFLSMMGEAINEGTINALAIVGVDSFLDLQNLKKWEGRTVYIRSGLNKDEGELFIYNSLRSNENDNLTVFNGWVKQINQYKPDSNIITFYTNQTHPTKITERDLLKKTIAERMSLILRGDLGQGKNNIPTRIGEGILQFTDLKVSNWSMFSCPKPYNNVFYLPINRFTSRVLGESQDLGLFKLFDDHIMGSTKFAYKGDKELVLTMKGHINLLLEFSDYFVTNAQYLQIKVSLSRVKLNSDYKYNYNDDQIIYTLPANLLTNRQKINHNFFYQTETNKVDVQNISENINYYQLDIPVCNDFMFLPNEEYVISVAYLNKDPDHTVNFGNVFSKVPILVLDSGISYTFDATHDVNRVFGNYYKGGFK